jgi:hypothetical protein
MYEKVLSGFISRAVNGQVVIHYMHVMNVALLARVKAEVFGSARCSQMLCLWLGKVSKQSLAP